MYIGCSTFLQQRYAHWISAWGDFVRHRSRNFPADIRQSSLHTGITCHDTRGQTSAHQCIGAVRNISILHRIQVSANLNNLHLLYIYIYSTLCFQNPPFTIASNQFIIYKFLVCRLLSTQHISPFLEIGPQPEWALRAQTHLPYKFNKHSI